MSHISIIFPFKWPYSNLGLSHHRIWGLEALMDFKPPISMGSPKGVPVPWHSMCTWAFSVCILSHPGLVGWGLPEHPEASQGVHRAKGAMWKMGKMDEKSIEVGEVYPVFPTNPFLDSEDRPTRGTLVVMHELKTYPHIQGLQGRWATSPTSADGGHCFFRTAISRGKLWENYGRTPWFHDPNRSYSYRRCLKPLDGKVPHHGSELWFL